MPAVSCTSFSSRAALRHPMASQFHFLWDPHRLQHPHPHPHPPAPTGSRKRHLQWGSRPRRLSTTHRFCKCRQLVSLRTHLSLRKHTKKLSLNPSPCRDGLRRLVGRLGTSQRTCLYTIQRMGLVTSQGTRLGLSQRTSRCTSLLFLARRGRKTQR